MKLKDIHIRDPFILPYDGTYYMYGKIEDGTENFCVYKSNDLTEWSSPKIVFTSSENFWADKDFWAPEVHIYNSRFYMFASFKADGYCRGTQILTCNSPDGIFVPITEYPVTPHDWECLDGTLYIDNNSRPHIVFCHEWQQIGDGTVCEMELSTDLTKAVGKPRVLWKASDYKDVVNVIPNKKSYVTDGPFFYKLDNDQLICVWSSFNKNGYAELVSRSNNGDISGGWTVNKRPLFARRGGHGMIFNTFEGQTMFIMHSPNDTPLERAVIYELNSELNFE